MKVHPLLLTRHYALFKNRQRAYSAPATRFKLLRDSGETAKLEKCPFLVEKLDHIGHSICLRRLEIANTTAATIKKLKDSKTQSELWSFFRLCNVFLRFVTILSYVALPLTRNYAKISQRNSRHFRCPRRN